MEKKNIITLKNAIFGWKIRTSVKEVSRHRNKLAKTYFLGKLINKWMAAFNKSKELEQRKLASTKLKCIN